MEGVSSPVNSEQKSMKKCDVKLYHVKLIGHCIFCFRKTSKKPAPPPNSSPSRPPKFTEQSETVPAAALLSLPTTLTISVLSTFNRIWPFLQRKADGCPLSVWNLSEDNPKKCTTFNRIPRMCQFCAEKLEAVDKLWRELVDHVQGLKTTMKESKVGGIYGWRAQKFEKALGDDSDLEEGCVQATLNFLEIGDQSCPDPVQVPSTSLEKPKSNPKLVRQNSIELPGKEDPSELFQQSSDIVTSQDMTFDLDEAEQADDESEPDYQKIGCRLEPVFSSDYSDSSDDEPLTIMSCDDDDDARIAYQTFAQNSSRSDSLFSGT